MLIYAAPASLLDPLSTVPVAPTCFQGICRLARNHSVWLSTSPMWLPLVLGRIWLPPFKVTHTAERVAFWAGPHIEISSACIGKTFASQSRPFSLYCASWYFWSLCMQHRPAAPWSAHLCQFDSHPPATGSGDIAWIFPGFSTPIVAAESRSFAIW